MLLQTKLAKWDEIQTKGFKLSSEHALKPYGKDESGQWCYHENSGA